jgi:hypothetical protein
MTTFQQQTLYTLFCLSRDNQRTDAGDLAAVLASTPTRVAVALVALEAAGLVDASRARLTMLGLATALHRRPAALGGTGTGLSRRPSAVAAPPMRVPLAAKPIAAHAAEF